MSAATASPYEGLAAGQWEAKTIELVSAHPLGADHGSPLVAAVQAAWDDIFQSTFGPKQLKIGVDIFPKPQILGFLLHELIPPRIELAFGSDWRVDKAADEKDLVYQPDKGLSVEIKTSSNANNICGNRSYAQETANGTKKDKSGYYLGINFQKCTKTTPTPTLVKVRFGWLDAADWTGQTAATGQQASLSTQVRDGKLLELYPLNKLP